MTVALDPDLASVLIAVVISQHHDGLMTEQSAVDYLFDRGWYDQQAWETAVQAHHHLELLTSDPVAGVEAWDDIPAHASLDGIYHRADVLRDHALREEQEAIRTLAGITP